MIIKDLDSIKYAEALAIQGELFQKKIASKSVGKDEEDVLIFCEHEPVYTLGKSGKLENLLSDEYEIRAEGIDFFKSNRGGDITFHGPGQIVVYPIFDLDHYRMGLKQYVNSIEQVVIDLLKMYSIPSGRLEKATGVWLGSGADERKIAAIGVKASRNITMHGLALNINTDLSFFNKINPCGFVDKGVTSLEKEIKKKVAMDEIKDKLVYQFNAKFMEG